MQVHTLPDIVCDGEEHVISTQGIRAKWVQFVGISVASNLAPIRVGDSNVEVGQGCPIFGAESGPFWPPDGSDISGAYDLGLHWYIGAAGDIFSVAYAV